MVLQGGKEMPWILVYNFAVVVVAAYLTIQEWWGFGLLVLMCALASSYSKEK
jgi:hypothetical protein